MEESERYFSRGIELMRQVLGDQAADAALANHNSPTKDVTSEMTDWAITNAFGYLLQRPGLSMRDRAIALVGADIAMRSPGATVRDHVRLALLNRLTREELHEILFLLVWYCGMPAVREARESVLSAIEEFEAEAARGSVSKEGRNVR